MGPPPCGRESYGALVLRRKSGVVRETMGGYGVERKDDPGIRRGREGSVVAELSRDDPVESKK